MKIENKNTIDKLNQYLKYLESINQLSRYFRYVKNIDDIQNINFYKTNISSSLKDILIDDKIYVDCKGNDQIKIIKGFDVLKYLRDEKISNILK